MLLAERSSDVRSHWAKFVDDVIHNEPKFVKRNDRDVFMSLNLEFMGVLVDNIQFNITIEEEDGEYIGTMENFWFVEEGESEKEVIRKLAESLKEFAFDYYKDLKVYRNTPEFKAMFPSITKALITNNIESLIESFHVEHKRS